MTNNTYAFIQSIGAAMILVSATSLVVMTYRLTDKYMDWALDQKSRKDKDDK